MEPALGIIAASVTTMRPLFHNWGFGWSNNSKNSRPSGAVWAESNGYPRNKEPPTSNVRGAGLNKSNSSGRTYEDIEMALSGTGSDIELNKTVRDDGRDDYDDYDASRPSSDLGHRDQAQGAQASHNRPVIKVRTTIDIKSHSIGHALPPAKSAISEKDVEVPVSPQTPDLPGKAL